MFKAFATIAAILCTAVLVIASLPAPASPAKIGLVSRTTGLSGDSPDLDFACAGFKGWVIAQVEAASNHQAIVYLGDDADLLMANCRSDLNASGYAITFVAQMNGKFVYLVSPS